MVVLDYKFNKDYWEHNNDFTCDCHVKYKDENGLVDYVIVSYDNRFAEVSIWHEECLGSWDFVYYDNFNCKDDKISKMLISSGIIRRFNNYIKDISDDFDELHYTEDLNKYFYGEEYYNESY